MTGSWQYAVRETDDDGDVIVWTSHSIFTHEPFRSVAEAREFAHDFDEGVIVRRLVSHSPWQPLRIAGGVCLDCGDAVLENGEHVDDERHERWVLTERLNRALDTVTVDHLVTQEAADELVEQLVDALMKETP